jgi:hypothetical protein
VPRTIAHGPEQPVPRLTVGWRVVDRAHAEPLIQRGLLDPRRLDGPDPHCLRCGHRALVHSLDPDRDKVPLEERWRWRTPPRPAENPRPCRRPGCGCSVWSPQVDSVSLFEDMARLVKARDTWIEVPLGTAWVVAYRIVGDRGRPVVGEVRIFPAEPGRPAGGHWSGEILGTRAPVPPGGITARLLRGFRVRAYLRVMAELIQQLRKEDPEDARVYGWSPEPPEPRVGLGGSQSRRGPKGRPDVFYADIARAYVQAIERESPGPVLAVAQARRLSPGKVRDMIRTARARHLLTEVLPGIPGGILTPKAEALLGSTKKKGRSQKGRPRPRPPRRTTQKRRRPR